MRGSLQQRPDPKAGTFPDRTRIDSMMKRGIVEIEIVRGLHASMERSDADSGEFAISRGAADVDSCPCGGVQGPDRWMDRTGPDLSEAGVLLVVGPRMGHHARNDRERGQGCDGF